MKNLLFLGISMLLITACNSTKNELRTSKRVEKKSLANTSAESSGILYASTKKSLIIDNNYYDSLQKKMDQAQQEMLRKIEKDKAESFANLKKSMTTKVYTTTQAGNTKKADDDNVYTVKGGVWIVVE